MPHMENIDELWSKALSEIEKNSASQALKRG